jgi:hypothetical protein
MMKWKIASYMTLGCVFTFGAINALRSDAQQPSSQPPGILPPGAVPPGSLPPGNPPREIPPRNVQQHGMDGMDIRGPNYPTLPALSPLGTVGLPNGPRMFPHTRTIKNPDGTEVHVTEMRITEDIRKSREGHPELRDSLSKLRSTDASESDKKAARETIEKFLKEEFERDQKNRREHVERLEEQVSKLRKQLDKRQESQAKIIALRMQLLENDAEGLSFPEGFNELQTINGGNPRGGYPPNTQTFSPPIMGGEGPQPSSPPYPQYPQYPQKIGPNQFIPRYDSSPKLPDFQ